MPIFPSDWPTATTDVANLTTGHQASTAKAKRLTPAQRRNNMYTQVVQAITQDDSDAITRLLDANPSVALDEPGHESISDALFKHFTPEVFDCLVNRGLPTHPTLYNVLTENFSQPLYERFVKKSQIDPQYNFEHFAETFFNTALKNILHPNSKVRASSRQLRNALLSDFPKLLNKTIEPYYSTLSWQVDLLNKLPLFYPESLHPQDYLFIEQLHPNLKAMCLRGIEARSKDVTISQLNSINRFFANHPAYAAMFDQQQNKDALTKKNNLDLWRSLIPVGANTWKETNLRAHLQDLQDQCKGGEVRMYTPYQHFTFDQAKNMDTTFERNDLVLTNPDLDQKLGFDVYDRLYHFYHKIRIAVVDEVDGTTAYKYKSEHGDDEFFTKMIVLGTPAATTLLKSPQMLERVNTLLNTKHHLMSWANHAPITAIQQLCKEHPHWKTWTDDTGNSLAHYVCALRSIMHVDEKTIGHLTRINPDWLLQANSNGVTLNEIVSSRFPAKKSFISWMEQQTLNAELKSDASTHKKMVSRPKSVRKM